MSEDKHEVSAALGRADALVQALRERGAAGPLQVAVETSEDEQPSVVLSAPRSRGRCIMAAGPTCDLRARLPLWLHKQLEERATRRMMAKTAYVCDLVMRDLGIDEKPS